MSSPLLLPEWNSPLCQMNDLSCVIGRNERRAWACHRHISCQHPSSIKRVLGQFISAFEMGSGRSHSHPKNAICLISQIQCVKLLIFWYFNTRERSYSQNASQFIIGRARIFLFVFFLLLFFLPRSTHEKCVWSQLLSWARSSEHEAYIALRLKNENTTSNFLKGNFPYRCGFVGSLPPVRLRLAQRREKEEKFRLMQCATTHDELRKNSSIIGLLGVSMMEISPSHSRSCVELESTWINH